MPTIGTMRLLGGRPSLDLVNTVDARRDTWGPDLLQSYDDLLVWGARTDILSDDEVDEARAAAQRDPAAAAAVFRRVVQVREAIADVIAALRDGDRVPELAADCLADAADVARQHQRLAPVHGQFMWTWVAGRSLTRVLDRVALDAAALLTDRAVLERVKLCPGHNCGWVFLDQSRNNARRWCRDEGCGAQARMQRFRARKA